MYIGGISKEELLIEPEETEGTGTSFFVSSFLMFSMYIYYEVFYISSSSFINKCAFLHIGFWHGKTGFAISQHRHVTRVMENARREVSSRSFSSRCRMTFTTTAKG